jgi:hypothetical protein
MCVCVCGGGEVEKRGQVTGGGWNEATLEEEERLAEVCGSGCFPNAVCGVGVRGGRWVGGGCGRGMK